MSYKVIEGDPYDYEGRCICCGGAVNEIHSSACYVPLQIIRKYSEALVNRLISVKQANEIIPDQYKEAVQQQVNKLAVDGVRPGKNRSFKYTTCKTCGHGTMVEDKR